MFMMQFKTEIINLLEIMQFFDIYILYERDTIHSHERIIFI